MKKNIRMISILLAILLLAVVMNTASGAGSRSGFRDLSMNGTDSNETDTNQTGSNQTDTNPTDTNPTDTNPTGSDQTETDQTGQNQTGENQTDTNQTGQNQTEVNQTDVNTTTPSAPGTVETVTLKKLKKLKVKALTKKSIRISWTKLTKKQRKSVQKIEVQISTDKSFGSGTVTRFVKNTKSSLTVKGLKKKTKYYVRIRAYTVKDGVTHVSPWTSVKSVKTKKK